MRQDSDPSRLAPGEQVGPRPAGGHPLPGGARKTVTRVLLTRAVEQSDELVSKLRAAHAEVVELPTIAIEPTDTCLPELAPYAWVVFTSANAVRAVGGSHRAHRVSWPPIAVVGAATASAAEQVGLTVTFRPSEPRGAVLGRELPIAPGERVLLVRSNIGRPELPAVLGERGALVDEAVAYRTIPRTEPAPEVAEQLKSGQIDAVLLASPSAARGLVAACGRTFHARTRVVAIGPTTAAAAAELGLTVSAVAREPTDDGLIDAIRRTE